MYSSIRISGYRGLDSFEMNGLGRVNLLVGTNNCGKTSILECIELLWAASNPYVLSSIVSRRGEWGHAPEGDARVTPGPDREVLEASHLFPNHEFQGEIHIEADRISGAAADGWNDTVTVHAGDARPSQYIEQGIDLDSDDERFFLRVKWSDAKREYKLFCTEEGLLKPRPPMRTQDGSSEEAQFIRASGMTAADVTRTFSKFVLTPSTMPSRMRFASSSRPSRT